MYVTNGVIKVKLAENTLEIHEGKDYLLIQTLYMKFVTRMKARVSIVEHCCPMSRNISILLMLVELLITQSIPFIKLIPKGEENVSLLRRIERVGTYLLITKRLLSTANSKRILSMSKSSLNILIMNKSINISLIQELNNVLNTLQSHYHKVQLSELSHMVHMSEAETIKLFKRFVGTRHSILQNYRLEQSAKQLMYHHKM